MDYGGASKKKGDMLAIYIHYSSRGENTRRKTLFSTCLR
jgi:hypothetical protein